MTPNEISLLRLTNQQIVPQKLKKPADIVSWMGAMQAQDYAMSRWALGIRLPDTSQATIQKAIDKGEIVRTHVMRPTWHLVSSVDVSWMIDLTAPQITSLLKSRHEQLSLTPSVLKKSMTIIERALDGGKHLIREELIGHLENNKISTRDQRGVHILLWAEMEKLICSGAVREKKNTYALFSERVKENKKIGRDEALAKLATRYFHSHGPATLQDFVNWSGLPNADAKKAIENLRDDLNSAKIGAGTYWFKYGTIAPQLLKESAFLLPAFDEFIIGYKDRSACLPPKHRPVVISVNGIFWPVIVVNGQVIGLWKRTVVKKDVKVELNLFPGIKPPGKVVKKLLAEASEEVKDFFSPVPRIRQRP